MNRGIRSSSFVHITYLQNRNYFMPFMYYMCANTCMNAWLVDPHIYMYMYLLALDGIEGIE